MAGCPSRCPNWRKWPGSGPRWSRGWSSWARSAKKTRRATPPYPLLDPDYGGKQLTEDQAAAAATLCAAIRADGYGTTLLHGVTGSGKTEVYLEAVAETLRRGRQALVLLPEIALTAEFLTRVEARFGMRAAEWHSGVTATERRRCWRMVAEGGAQLVVGARSALFLPFRDLGLIVVDEEHDSSYKQEEGVLYNARDMAVLRASINQAQVVLASATPSLESWANAEAGKYGRLDLTARYGAAVMPKMAAIDMRDEDLASGRWISPTLEAGIRDRIEKGEQSLIFLNRRGYAPVTLCRACGNQIGCDHCDARMVEHRFLKRLMCHQCGETKPMPETCPSCGVAGRLAAVGPGVERMAEEAAMLFGQARIAVLSSDLFGSARALKEQIEAIARGRCRYHHRHPAGRQGAQLSASDAGRGDRCRSGPAGLGPARRRADLPADAAGGRAGRAGGCAGHGAAAKLPARASGDPRDSGGR